MLLGRAIRPRFWPFFVLLLALSALDTAQQLVPSSAASTESARPPGYFYAMFVVQIGGARSAIGIFDLLLAAAIGEHGRRRSQPPWRAVLPAPLGLLLVEIINAIRSVGSVPLFPFLTLGWLVCQIPWPAQTVRARPAPRSTLE